MTARHLDAVKIRGGRKGHAWRTRKIPRLGKRYLYVGEDPGVTLGTSRNHEVVTPRLIKHRAGIGSAANVAITNDRKGDSLLYAGDTPPVSITVVELEGKAPVDGQAACPCLFHAPRKVRSGFIPLRPAAPHLDRDRRLNSRPHFPHDMCSKSRFTHQSRTVPFFHNLSSRTAHVDVDDGKALTELLLNPGSLASHDRRFVAEELDAHTRLVRAQFE